MSATKILLLPDRDDQPALCLAVDASGAVVARNSLAADTRSAGPSEPCLLAVPAADIGLHRLRLRASSAAQAAAAASRLLQDRLAVPAASLHVAVSDADGDDGRWVAVVDKARMQAWLERASRHGFQPTAMVPDCLLLAAPEAGAWRVLESDLQWLVRGESTAFSAEPELARAVLDGCGAAAENRHATGEDELARAAVSGAPTIDLLQHGYSLQPAAPEGWAAWRTVAVLAALVLALLPLGYALQALRHELALRSIYGQASAQLQTVSALTESTADPFARARAALATARLRDSFEITTAALFESLQPMPGAGVARLDYGHDAVLTVTLDHGQAEELLRLTDALAERGVTASLDSTQASGGRLRSVLLLAVAP